MRTTYPWAALGCALGILLLPSVSHATDGYFTHGFGTKTKALAGAGVALPQDAMAAATNPAGMVLVGKQFEVGMALFEPSRSYTVNGPPSGAPGTFGMTPGTVTSRLGHFGVPHMAANWMLDDNDSVGLTIYGNGGMNTSYPSAAGGGQGTFYAGPAGVNLEQLFVSPSYSRRTSNSSWGVAAVFAYQRFEAKGLGSLGSMVSDGTPDNLSNRGVDSSVGLGLRLGAQGTVTPNLSLGAAYQSQITMGKLSKYSDLFSGHGAFDIPASATVGLAWKTQRTSVLAFDIQYIWYSAVHSVGNPFANLASSMSGNDPSGFLGGSNGAGFGWKDMTVYKLGYQWQSGPDWTLRAGVSYGRQPIRSSEVLFNILAPGVQKWHYTLGVTKKMSPRHEFSLALMYSPDKTVTGPNPMEAPGQQNISLNMRQFEAEASWAFHY